MNTQTLRKRFIEGLFWVAATKAVGQAITWVISIVVVRLLSPHDYGLMGAALLFTGFLFLFNELGLGAAIVRAPSLNTETVRQLRWAILAINLVMTGLLVAAAPLVAWYFNEPALTAIIRTLSLGFVIHALGVPSASMLHREMAFKKKARAEMLANLVGGVSTFAAATAGMAVWSLVLGYLLQQSVMTALYCAYRPVSFAPGFSIANVRTFVNFGAQVASSRVLWFISSNADFLVVGRMLGSVQLGYYSLAFQLSSLPIDKIVSMVTQVALPSFSALQDDAPQLRRYYLKLVSTVAFVTFPMFLGLLLVAEDVVTVLLTSKWLPIVAPLKILCLVSMLRAIETMNSPLLFARGRAGIQVLNSLIQAIVLPVAFVIGAQWGLQGVAIAWLVTWPVLFGLVTGSTLRVLGLRVTAYLDAVRHPATAAVLMTCCVVSLRYFLLDGPPSVVGLLLTCLAGALTYVAYYTVFHREMIRDIASAVTGGRRESVASRQSEVIRSAVDGPAAVLHSEPSSHGV